MDRKDFENTVPAVAELEVFQEAAAVEPEPDNSSENGGNCEQMEVVAAESEPDNFSESDGNGKQMEVVAAEPEADNLSENDGNCEQMEVVAPEPEPDNLSEHDGTGKQMEAVAAEAEPDNLLENSGNGEQMEVAVANGYGDGSLPVKRKRGRPRKQLGEIRPECRLMEENSGGSQKRGRGRPKGSGKWQTWGASLGLSAAGASNLTPYIFDIEAGENIVERILSFSQKTSDSICILSASGTVSRAEFFIPASRGGILRYEGQFSIVCLNGSHTYKEKSSAKTCLLSAQLATSDGRFCGGAVAHSLVAAGPTQVIVSTFKQNWRKQRSKVRGASIAAPKPNGRAADAVAAAALVQEEVAADSATAAAQRAADDDGEEEEEEEENGMMDEPNAVTQPSSPDWNSLQPSNISDV